MSLHQSFKSVYLTVGRTLSDNRLLDFKWFLEQEVDTWNDWVSLPVRQRLELWRHGFTSPFGVLYDFDTYGYEPFISDRQMYQLYKRANEPHRYLLDDKLSQHWMLADTPENRPTAYGLLERGYVHGVAGSTFEGGAVPIDEWLPSKLREESPLVLKYLRGEAGKQVLVCDVDEKGFLLNERRVSESELCAELEPLTGYLVTEYVHQHEYADTLYPHSPNTIRILTIWDDDRRELLVPAAVQRIGTERSRPVDNFSIGGLSAEIDPETGTLSQAARYPRSGGVSWYSTHPDTDVQIEGVTVPHWDRIQSVVTSLATNATNIPIIGWDVLLDESGVPIVLEANTGTHFDVLQLHRPLLHDPDVARVFSRYLPSVDAPKQHR